MKIGWIGAGIMGSPMIMHLIDHQSLCGNRNDSLHFVHQE